MISAANRPQVWIAAVLAEPNLGAALRQLGEHERRRYAAFSHKAAGQRFVTGRVMARLALSDATGNAVEPSSWQIDVDAKGKPFVTGPDRTFGISIAHTGSMAAVAVCANEDVGIDIECYDEAKDVEPVAAVLSFTDQLKLMTCRGEDRRREFVKLWTMKEAYAKWRGDGLSLDFGALDFDWVPGRLLQCARCGQANVHLNSIFLNGQYFTALASRIGLPPVFSFQNLEPRLFCAGR